MNDISFKQWLELDEGALDWFGQQKWIRKGIATAGILGGGLSAARANDNIQSYLTPKQASQAQKQEITPRQQLGSNYKGKFDDVIQRAKIGYDKLTSL